MRLTTLLALSLAGFTSLPALAADPQPADSSSGQIQPVAAPAPAGLLLRRGDRLAICGDSITEQKKYSRLMEDYLTMCVPQLEISIRQYGWGGETASGFFARMTNDCLRFKPTIATTSYGMNDHHYKPYEDAIGLEYRSNMMAVVSAFKTHDVRFVIGSPGPIGKIPWWEAGKYQVKDLNVNLCQLRNIDAEIAKQENAGFADVFVPLYTLSSESRQKYGANYNLTGQDGIHPDWAGHLVMAYAYLKALGLDGQIGTFTVDLKANAMQLSAGHKLMSSQPGEFEIASSRYPFCPCGPSGITTAGYPNYGSDPVTSSDSIRSGLSLIPFNQDLNRFMLIAHNGTAQSYRVTWGDASKTFTAQQLAAGINLIEEFPENPFSAAFAVVDGAVANKQDFETREMKGLFRLTGTDKPTMEQIVAQTDKVLKPLEKEHAALDAAVHAAFSPVTYTIKIVPQ